MIVYAKDTEIQADNRFMDDQIKGFLLRNGSYVK